MNTQKTLLVIEDEPAILRYLNASLDVSLWRILEARTSLHGLELAASEKPDVILLDLGLPHGEAMELLRTLRQWTLTPIILLSAMGLEKDQATALEAGADDYLVKPFRMEELKDRLGLALRHAERRAEEVPIYEWNGLQVDLFARRVRLHNKEIHLSPREYECLAVLVRHAGRLVSQQQLMQEIWGHDQEVTLDALRVFVHQLRHKIEPDPLNPRCLVTEPGVGYRLESPIFSKKVAEQNITISPSKISRINGLLRV